MNIALIGATGFVGSGILREALTRGHEITALVRDPEGLTPHPRLRAQKADVYDVADVARLVAGHDAVISAFNPGWSNPDIYNLQLKGTRAIIDGVKKAGVKRLLFVGGSGSLEVKPGVQGVDLPGFPEQYKQGALATREALTMLREETSLEWSVLSPSADLFPGERTGQFRLGTDQLLRDANGESRISIEDFAVAMLDEAERPAHVRRRFTVGY
ncbi:MAG: 3-beta hydroxysteroid dehydrogenase [Nitrospira sp. SG-bin1]|nr:MAG: 3-beta hydroxysteroid dehydrogenase [Nitrospira sp. SG-bin1]